MLKSLRSRIFSLFEPVIDQKVSLEVPHRAEIRASSLPFCYRDIALTAWAKKGNRCPTKEWSLGATLYTDIGTAVHASIQRYLGGAGFLWGSWKCNHCGKVYLNQTSPGVCCEDLVEYVEYSLVHPNPEIGEFGHCDGIIVLPHKMGWFELEIKTTGQSLAAKRKEQGPAEEHQQQVGIYHEMFDAGYARVRERGRPEPGERHGPILIDEKAKMPPGPHLKVVLVIYVLRDKPKPRYWIPLVRRPRLGGLADIEKNVPRVKKAIRIGTLPPGTCKKYDDAKNPYNFREVCPWAREVCFNKTESPKSAGRRVFLWSKTPHKTKRKVDLSKSFIKRKSDR